MLWAKSTVIITFVSLSIFALSAFAEVKCGNVHLNGKGLISSQSIFEKADMTKISDDEIKPLKNLRVIWSEKDRVRVRKSWSPRQVEELTQILNVDAETAIDLYAKVLDLKETYELPEYAFVVSVRLEEAIAKLNLKLFNFEGDLVELKFKYHSVNRFIFERLVLETRQVNFSAEQLAVLIKSEKMYRAAEEKQLAGNKAALSEVKLEIMTLVSRYFPSEVLPDIKTVLRVILVKGASSKGCCGFGCSTCITYKVRGALELLNRVTGSSTLPLVQALQAN